MRTHKGSLLLELLLTTLLASIILTMLYQLYRTVFRNIEYIKHDNNMQIEKLTALYNIQSDAFQIILPPITEEIYKTYNSYKKKASTNIQEENSLKKETQDTDKNREKEKKELEKNIQKLNKFIPTIETTENKIIVSWITARSLFSKELFSKVSYIFKKTKFSYQDQPIYTLYRKETPLDQTYTLEDKEKEYKLISSIINPDISCIFQTFNADKEKKDVSESKEKKVEEKRKFSQWKERKTFEKKTKTDVLTLENFSESVLMPQTLRINGNILSNDKKKATDFLFTINFPPADFAFELFLDQKEDILEKKSRTQQAIPTSFSVASGPQEEKKGT